MSNYLNPGNTAFRKLIEGDVYVDKTGLLSYTNGRIGKEDGYICVSHPRRFGKSAAANMLVAYYSRGCDSRDLFKGLKIAQDPSFEEHLNRYNVIRINVAQVIKTDVDAEAGLKEIRRGLRSDLKKAYPDISYEDGDGIPSMLNTVYQETDTPFIFVIDEWDCPMRERPDDKDSQKLYLQFLKDLLKDRDYLALAYMTGILPIKKNVIGSSLNAFDEFTIISPKPLQEYFGFTEEEVRDLSGKYGIPFEGLKEWYDGYDVGGVPMYNPNSVSNALRHDSLESYWTKTESYEELGVYIKDNKFGIHDVVMRLILGETHSVNPDLFANDLVTLECLDDVLTLLVHLGYLTYDETTGRVRIPNLEIRREFVGTVERMKVDPYTAIITDARKLFEAFRGRDAESAEKSLDSICHKLTETLDYDNEAALSAAVVVSCISSADGSYVISPEKRAGEGYADYILTPTKGAWNLPMIIELKYDKSADEAMGQIRKKRYAEYFKGYEGDIVLIGINCDDETKRHGCRMEVVRNA